MDVYNNRLQSAHIFADLYNENHKEIYFEFKGNTIVNPWFDETMRFYVDPVAYYGKENIDNFLEQLEKKYIVLEYVGCGVFRAYNNETFTGIMYDPSTLQVVFQSIETGVLHIEHPLNYDYTAFMNVTNDEKNSFALIRLFTDLDTRNKYEMIN